MITTFNNAVFRVVLVEPYYAGNIGSVARLIKNFSFHQLYLVKPRAYHLSDEAFQWAMHAKDVLERATVVKRLEDALKDASLVVATTAKPHEKMVRRTPITPKKLAEVVEPYWNSDEVVAIMFGREPSGLANEELDMADILVTIPTSPEYPAMNLSHSVAVILYEIYTRKHRLRRKFPPPKRAWETLQRFLRETIKLTKRHNPHEVEKAILAAYRRGARTEKEVNAFIGLLSYFVRRCGDEKNREGSREGRPQGSP